jgi:hypothetical protein
MKPVNRAKPGNRTKKKAPPKPPQPLDEISIGGPKQHPTEPDDAADSLMAELDNEEEVPTQTPSPTIAEDVMSDLEEVEEQVAASGQDKVVEKRSVQDVLNMFGKGVLETPEVNMLRNPARKEAVEKRCAERNQPLSIADLFSQGYLTQKVPIIEGKFEVTFKTLRELEDIAIDELVGEYASKDDGTLTSMAVERYRFRCTLAAGLVDINGQTLPRHVKRKDGEFVIDKAALHKRIRYLESRPKAVLAELGVQYGWFEERVKMVFLEDDLKNG